MNRLPLRTYWVEDNRYSIKDYEWQKCRRRVGKPEGYLISSLCENGRHAPALDFDFPITIREEPIGPDNQLDFFRKVPLDRLYGLYEIFTACGFLGERDLNSVGRISFSLRDYHEKKPYHFCPRLIAPFRLLPSSTTGHFHLYIDKEIEWPQYQDLLARLGEAGLIEENYLRACRKHEKSFLLKPGVTKDDILRMQERGRAKAYRITDY